MYLWHAEVVITYQLLRSRAAQNGKMYDLHSQYRHINDSTNTNIANNLIPNILAIQNLFTMIGEKHVFLCECILLTVCLSVKNSSILQSTMLQMLHCWGWGWGHMNSIQLRKSEIDNWQKSKQGFPRVLLD